MIRRSHKRFRVSSETVRLLTDPALHGVIGGALSVLTVVTESCRSSPTYTTCPDTTPAPHTRNHECGDQ